MSDEIALLRREDSDAVRFCVDKGSDPSTIAGGVQEYARAGGPEFVARGQESGYSAQCVVRAVPSLSRLPVPVAPAQPIV
jgi:hypothetical protein